MALQGLSESANRIVPSLFLPIFTPESLVRALQCFVGGTVQKTLNDSRTLFMTVPKKAEVLGINRKFFAS
jgi:hypothetical protein